MRLLSKREVDQAKQKDRQQEIEEGMKLARKVDDLRETASEEETRLQLFRQKSVEQLHAEIQPLEKKKSSLEEEVKDLEHRKKLALAPLDAEWERMKEEGRKVTLKKFELDDREALVKKSEIDIENSKKELEIEKGRLQDFKRTTSENLVQSENTLKQAQEEARDVRENARKVTALAKSRNKVSLDREAKVAVREREVLLREQSNLKKDIDLAKRERILKDRYSTLQRTLKRHGTDSISF